MAGKVLNIKLCSPPKLCVGLTGNYHAICHYSYNLPLPVIMKKLIFLILICSLNISLSQTNVPEGKWISDENLRNEN